MASSALPLLLAAVTALLITGAAAQTSYTGPMTFTAQDTNPGHKLADCTKATGCAPFTVAFTTTGVKGVRYTLSLPSSFVLATGLTDSASGAGSSAVSLPWGKYTVTLVLNTITVLLNFTVTGFNETILGKNNAFASDAKYGLFNDLRWSYYALQANNSVFTPGVEQQFWTGSATHYHPHCYWRLALDPANNNSHALTNFVVIIFPYYANGTANNEGSLLNLYPSRTTNKAFNVTIGDAPFYTGPARKMCTLVGTNPTTPNWPANVIYKCDPTFPARYLVATATQFVPNDTYPTNASIDDRATKLALHYVRYFAPLYPTYGPSAP